jgi:thioredoxin reductase
MIYFKASNRMDSFHACRQPRGYERPYDGGGKMMRRDIVIAGSGLAGSMLAYEFRSRNISHMLLSGDDPSQGHKSLLEAYQKRLDIVAGHPLTGFREKEGAVVCTTRKGDLEARYLVLAIGLPRETNSGLYRLLGESIDEESRILTREHSRVAGKENLFAVGRCCSGEYYPAQAKALANHLESLIRS